MTPPDRLRTALHVLGWSQRDLSRRLVRDERTVRRWASGEYEAPLAVLAWLERLSAFLGANPPPGRE